MHPDLKLGLEQAKNNEFATPPNIEKDLADFINTSPIGISLNPLWKGGQRKHCHNFTNLEPPAKNTKKPNSMGRAKRRQAAAINRKRKEGG